MLGWAKRKSVEGGNFFLPLLHAETWSASISPKDNILLLEEQGLYENLRDALTNLLKII